MRIEENVVLSKYTTFRMGGVAKKLLIPETEEELLGIIRDTKLPRYIIGGGSNLLINDQREFDTIISLREFNKEIRSIGDGKYYVGASVHLQKLIKTINEEGYGGIEYLYSVPGLVGGAIVMNAGRGNSVDEIGKFVVSVRAIVDEEIQEIHVNDCQFKRRSSLFKNSDIVVLGASFQFSPGDSNDFKSKRDERIKHATDIQDNSKPNVGTVFSKADAHIMKMFQMLVKPNTKGVHFSSKTRNWLLNDNGTFQQTMTEINKVKKVHRLLHRHCEPEVIIWK